MEIHPVDIVIHILNIIVLFVVLRMLLYKPVKKFMQAREDSMKAREQQISDAEAAASELKKQYDEKLVSAELEAKNVIRESTEKASAQSEQIIKEAEERANRILDDARASAEKEKHDVMESLRQDVVAAAADMASKILSREVNAEDNAKIAEDFFSELETK